MKKLYVAFFVLPILLGNGVSYLPGGDVSIVENGKSEYVIVYPQTCDFKIRAAANNLSKEIKKLTGVDIKVVTDKTPLNGAAKKPCEILVGDTSREPSQKAKKGLLYKDFAIKLYDNTLAINAIAPDTYKDAVQYVVDSFVTAEGMSVKRGYRYVKKGDYEISVLKLFDKDISQYKIVAGNDSLKDYATKLQSSLLDKTGIELEIAADRAATESEIVFDISKTVADDEYFVKHENGDIIIGAPTGMGVEQAYDDFARTVFGDGETKMKIVDIDSIDLDGKLEPTNSYEKFINARGSLANTREKLKNQKKLNVAYYGGSVTCGVGATKSDETSWRGLTDKWLRENFPDAEIKQIYAAIGASGSHFGAFRVERDVIAHAPDLVFIEFSVNDSYNGENEASAQKNYESIVRSIRRAYPDCDIINIYITDSGKTSNGGVYIQKTAQETVAKAYDIPSIDVGKALAVKKQLRGIGIGEWNKYFTDSVHMTDLGYSIYSEAISEYLANELIFAKQTEPKAHVLPTPVNASSDDKLTYLLAADIEKTKLASNGFNLTNGSVYGGYSVHQLSPYTEYYLVNQEDNSLELEFEGTELALAMSDYTSGTIRYTIDGKKGSVTRNSMNNPFYIVKNLPNGKHTIKIEIGFDGSSKSAKVVAVLVR